MLSSPSREVEGAFPLCEIEAEEDEGASEEEVRGYCFVEHNAGGYDGGKGIEVDPIGGLDGTQATDAPIPHEETDHGGYAPEEEQVGEHLGLAQYIEVGETGHHQIIGQDGEHTVEKHLAGDEDRGVALQGGFHHQRIEGPTEAGGESQEVAYGRELEDEPPVQHHNDHAYAGYEGAKHLPPLHGLATVKELVGEQGEQGARADDERHVGGGGEAQGFVLCEEVDGATSDAESGHQQLILPRVGKPLVGCTPLPQEGEAEHEHVGYDEAQGKYLCR